MDWTFLVSFTLKLKQIYLQFSTTLATAEMRDLKVYYFSTQPLHADG